jgi:hypothetical protein
MLLKYLKFENMSVSGMVVLINTVCFLHNLSDMKFVWQAIIIRILQGRGSELGHGLGALRAQSVLGKLSGE